MRWLALALLLVADCTTSSVTPTSLAGSISCGSASCGSGQICFSMQSGSLCDVNPDAGIGQYQEFGWTCGELPADCDGVTRDCFSGPFVVVSADGRYVMDECI